VPPAGASAGRLASRELDGLVSTLSKFEPGDRPTIETLGPVSKRWPDLAYWHSESDLISPSLTH